MDILKKYEADRPQVVQQQIRQFRPVPEYGFLVRMVMRFSGGKIQDARGASMALFGITIGIIIIAAFVFFFGGSGAQIPSPGPAPL